MTDSSSATTRILALLAVSIAIMAVSWTIRDPTLIVIGIAGLSAGHYYNWRRRNAATQFKLLLPIFICLIVFLGWQIMLSGLGDKLLLSRYLIYGLVLASFGLMRRRNIMASLILGSLLLVLVSESALDLRFTVFILVFIILALTTVAYSRIEMQRSQAEIIGKLESISVVKAWGSFLLGTIAIAAVFFLTMPRLVNSQVSQASWLPSRLDLSLRGIAMLPSRPSASVSPGIFPTQNERTPLGGYATLGYGGSSADKPVIQVRSQISSYWRGMILDEYDGRGWLTILPQIELRDESKQEYILGDSRINLSGERVYWQAFYMLSDQPNAIFTGYNPGRIYLPLTWQNTLESGMLYRALSVVPYVRPESLRIDRAAIEDVWNLSLPAISERTAVLAESIVAGATTDYDKAARIERFLLTNYPYDLNVAALPTGYDAVDYFLFEQQAGYCAHFATAMAVMARHIGLPARIAVGYVPGIIDPMTGAHVVRAGDAHAWVEIHFQRNGWVAFDPTPRPDMAMGFAGRGNWVYFGLERFAGVNLANPLISLKDGIQSTLHSLTKWVWVVFIIFIVAMIMILVRRRRPQQGVRTYSVLPGEHREAMLKLYHKMLAILLKKGFPPRLPSQPSYEYAAIVLATLPEVREHIQYLTREANRAAYDPHPFESKTVAQANIVLRDLKTVLNRHQRSNI